MVNKDSNMYVKIRTQCTRTDEEIEVMFSNFTDRSRILPSLTNFNAYKADYFKNNRTYYRTEVCKGSLLTILDTAYENPMSCQYPYSHSIMAVIILESGNVMTTEVTNLFYMEGEYDYTQQDT